MFFRFFRKLSPTKTQQITDKVSKYNGHKTFCGIWSSRASTGVVSTSSYRLSSIHCTPSQFFPTTLFDSSKKIGFRPLGMGGHVKAYNRVTPRPPNKAGVKMTTYPAAEKYPTTTAPPETDIPSHPDTYNK